jgi:hypothetical protein
VFYGGQKDPYLAIPFGSDPKSALLNPHKSKRGCFLGATLSRNPNECFELEGGMRQSEMHYH